MIALAREPQPATRSATTNHSRMDKAMSQIVIARAPKCSPR